jgi:RNA polymerase sigma-70 factor (ECF subfamily)
MDAERQHVPAARVDAHVESCPDCRQWLAAAVEVTQRTRQAGLSAGPDLSERILGAVDAAPANRGGRLASRLIRCALAGAGLAQMGVAVAQIGGVDFGMVAAGQHGAMTGAHLLNESTAWSLALGFGMVVAAMRPAAALGVATVLGVFAVVLAGYVVSDAWAGQVTAGRLASHIPVIAGLPLVLLVYRGRVRARRAGPAREDIVLPAGASRGRRRGHLRPTDHSAA